MSAIFGIIDLNQKKIDPKISERFRKEYASYQIDRLEDAFIPNAYFGCGIQYFRNIAKNEQLPIIDEKNKLFFTADCFLDNRDEMLDKLSLPQATPDGNIIYEAFLKWRTQCVDFLRGIFAFVIYDWGKNEIYFFTDHFGGRNVYICKRDNIVYFSSLLFPLVKASQLKFEENERWLADCIGNFSPVMITENRETAIKGICKTESSHYIFVSKESFRYLQYWFPNKIKVNNKLTDIDCEQQLKKILTKSVNNMICIEQNVAVLLSSGLDSSTIACIAAPILKRQNKSLYCYTSIPSPKSNLKQDGYLIYDETDGVKKICAAYDNMIPHFMTCEDKNIFSEAQNVVDSWNLPSKSRQNAVWGQVLRQAAQKDGCKIVLTGSSGNTNISAGDFETYLLDSIHRLKFIKAYRDFNAFAKKYKFKRKYILKYILSAKLNDITKRYSHKNSAFLNGYLNKFIDKKYHITKRLQKEIVSTNNIPSFKELRSFIFFPKYNAQNYEIKTNLSLSLGILDRDPLQNVEFIEFLMTLPLHFFVNEQYERRLVREFMSEIVPEDIRLDVKHRGRQSGDEFYRMKAFFNQHFHELKSKIYSERLFKYIDKNKLNNLLASVELNLDDVEDDILVFLANLYTFSIFCKRIDDIN